MLSHKGMQVLNSVYIASHYHRVLACLQPAETQRLPSGNTFSPKEYHVSPSLWGGPVADTFLSLVN